MKVCLVGVGSIAKRHIRNMTEICAAKGISLQIDALRRKESKKGEDFPKQINDIYYNINDVPSDYDVIFLTNPTEYHAESLCKLHDKGRHFFIEKPVVSLSTIDKLNAIVLREDSIYYVACPLRYNSVIQYIKTHIDVSSVNCVRSISSSYLPDWRPDMDYRETYSAHKDLGGGVSIDLIHEWDYLTYIFGMPQKVNMLKGKISNLEIDCEDYAVYIAEYSSMIVELHLDYFGRKSLRKIEIYTEEDTIIGDIIEGTITYLKLNKVISLPKERDSYQKAELLHFLSLIKKNQKSDNDIDNALKVLRLTQGEI